MTIIQFFELFISYFKVWGSKIKLSSSEWSCWDLKEAASKKKILSPSYDFPVIIICKKVPLYLLKKYVTKSPDVIGRNQMATMATIAAKIISWVMTMRVLNVVVKRCCHYWISLCFELELFQRLWSLLGKFDWTPNFLSSIRPWWTFHSFYHHKIH